MVKIWSEAKHVGTLISTKSVGNKRVNITKKYKPKEGESKRRP